MNYLNYSGDMFIIHSVMKYRDGVESLGMLGSIVIRVNDDINRPKSLYRYTDATGLIHEDAPNVEIKEDELHYISHKLQRRIQELEAEMFIIKNLKAHLKNKI